MAAVQLMVDSTLTGPVWLDKSSNSKVGNLLLGILKPKVTVNAAGLNLAEAPYGEPDGLLAFYIVVGILVLAGYGVMKAVRLL